jgi:shikimate dehydrogenase
MHRIGGSTQIIAHVGYPTHTFRSPSIYNPWFAHAGVDAVAVPMGVKAEDFAAFLPAVFSLTNIRGAVITMPHKRTTVALLDDASPAVRVSGACNAVRKDAEGRLVGAMFDGEGFVRGAQRKGCRVEGARALVVGSGGVGSAIAAALAGSGVAGITLHDIDAASAEALATRLRQHYPTVDVRVAASDPAGHDIVVNATPLGMKDDDPLPIDPAHVASTAFVGEVVLSGMTPFARAVAARGCRFLLGNDMLLEQFPAFLEFFGFPIAEPDVLRKLAGL